MITELRTEFFKEENNKMILISAIPNGLFSGFGANPRLSSVAPHKKVKLLAGCSIDILEKRQLSNTFIAQLLYKNNVKNDTFNEVNYKTKIVDGEIIW